VHQAIGFDVDGATAYDARASASDDLRADAEMLRWESDVTPYLAIMCVSIVLLLLALIVFEVFGNFGQFNFR
jgi:hypothetical protein